MRRTIFASLVAVCAVLTLFPQKYRAAISLTPSDAVSFGLSATLGQLGAVGSILGNQAAVEVNLKVARSEFVRSTVAKQLDLEKVLGKSTVGTHRWLEDEVGIRALRGGIIQIEVKDRDPQFAKRLVTAYGEAVRTQLAAISRKQTAYKRDILVKLVEDASDRLAQAQAAYDTFRLQTRYTSPQAAIYATGGRVPELENIIRSKEVELNAERQFSTDENFKVRRMLAEIEALKRQLAVARSTAPVDETSVGLAVRQTTEVDRLRRELILAQSLYDNYKLHLQGTSVEDLASITNIRVIEPAYIDTARQLNFLPLALGVFILLLGLTIEFYRLRPPLEERDEA